MYNQSEVKPLDKKQSKVVNPKNNKKYSIEFHLVRGDCKSILGLRASEYLQLLTVNNQDIFSVESSGVEEKGPKVKGYISQCTDVFPGEGKPDGLLHLEIDKNVQPVQLSTRKVPIAIALREPSSFATTFGTPWGRYRLLCLPFGVSPAPGEFQRSIDITLEGLPGQKAIAEQNRTARWRTVTFFGALTLSLRSSWASFSAPEDYVSRTGFAALQRLI